MAQECLQMLLTIVLCSYHEHTLDCNKNLHNFQNDHSKRLDFGIVV